SPYVARAQRARGFSNHEHSSLLASKVARALGAKGLALRSNASRNNSACFILVCLNSVNAHGERAAPSDGSNPVRPMENQRYASSPISRSYPHLGVLQPGRGHLLSGDL